MAKTLAELIGSYDNLSEPPSLLNYPRNILAIVITFMVFTWICVLLRLYTRLFIARCPGWDDVFVVLSLLSTSAGSISICLATTRGGMGRHFVLLGEEKMMEYLRIFYVANATYPGSAGLIKLAILMQYLRVYDRESPFRRVIVATIWIVVVWSLVFAVMAWVPTVPVYAYWDLDVPATRYGFGSIYVEPFVAVYTGLTSSNMVLDLVILFLAVPLFVSSGNGAKEERYSRRALVSLFTIGSLASIFSIWRLASIIKTRATTHPGFDPTWYGATPIVLAALEVDVATICAALPVFWPVLCSIDMKHIMVTREVKVTLEHRRLSTGRMTRPSSDSLDDGIELGRSESGLQQQDQQQQQQGGGGRDHYRDPYVAQQVDPFKSAEFGVTFAIDGLPSGRASSDKGLGRRGGL